MNDATKPEEPTAISSTPVNSLDAGLAVGFGRRADGATSLLAKLSGKYLSVPPVLLHEAEGDSGHVLRPKSDAIPKQAETGGRYQVAGEIARGGMGAVLRGRDVELGRELAIKVLLEKYVDRPEIARRFIEEAQIGGQLQHPGVVPVYDIGSFGERPFFTMKLVKGRTLASILGERTDLGHDRPRLLTIALQVAQTLAYAHAKGVIHRDLKPANIMVGAFGEVQVMDWGLAKVLAEGGIADEEQASRAHRPPEVEPTVIRTARSGSAGSGSDTEAGSLLGTPAYMPPEQANGDVANLDRRADVFGLGAILCEILTAKPPYVGRTGDEVRRKAANGALADAHGRLAACGADAELTALTTGCLAPEANDRPKDAQEVTAALTAYLDGVQERLRRAELDKAAAEARAQEEVNTRRMAEAKAVEERKRRRTQMALAVAVLALFCLAAGGVWYQQRQRATTEAQRASRQAGTAASIAESLVDARQRMTEAWSATSFPDRMKAATDAAEAAVRRSEGYATAGEPTEKSRAELAAVRNSLADLTRHTRLVVDYEWLQDGFANWDGDAISGTYDTAVRRHEEALKRFGLDPLKAPEDQTARSITADRLRDTLIGMLSTWQNLRKENFGYDADARVMRSSWQLKPEQRVAYDRLGLVIRLTRLQCGGAYARWQDLFDRKDWKGLAAFASTAEMLELGPSLVNAVSRDLQNTALDYEAARNLLRAACDRYPHAVFIRFDLALSCQSMSPPGHLEALQQFAALAALKPDALLFQFHLAHTYEALRDEKQAMLVHTKAAERGSVVSAGELARMYLEGGNFDAAIASYRRTLALAPGTPLGAKGYIFMTEKRLGRVLRLRAIQDRLPRLLSGEDKPGSASEALDIAEACRYKHMYEAASRFYTGAFALEPTLADDQNLYRRYNAAWCAALTAAGRGDDAAKLDDGARARLRRQALKWLREDLAVWTKREAAGEAGDRSAAREMLAHWCRDKDLGSVRDADALAKLPAEEREAFAALWAEVDALLKKVRSEPK